MATQTMASKVTLAAGATTINQPSLSVTSTLGVVPGAILYHANIPSGTTISSVTNATTIVMSANATATGSSLAVVAINPAIVNVDLIARGTWANNDTLAITEGQQVLINTNQTKFWNVVTLTNGTLRIENTSTTAGISFGMGRSSGAGAANAITPANGLGKIEIAGNWITLGTGNNGAQDFTAPFTDFIPAVWVQTATGWEVWLNITSAYGQGWAHMRDGLASIGTGKRNKFFRQIAANEPYTAGQTAAVQWTTTLRFGEDGNTVPSNMTVKVPNIMITDYTANNYYSTASQFSNRTWLAQFNLGNGGSMTVDKALFHLSYVNATQAQNFSIQNCAFAISPLVTECYSFVANSVGITIQPTTRYVNNGPWTYMENRYWSAAWNYINNASITDLYMCAADSITTANSMNGVLFLTYSTNVTINNLTIYCVNKMPRGTIITYAHNAFYGGYLKDCTFTNLKCYGGGIYFTNVNNCTIDGLEVSEGMYDAQVGVVSGHRIGINPATGAALVANTPYYFKVRSYHSYWDINDYYENPIVYSATVYGGHRAGKPMHPFTFGAQLKPNAGAWDVILLWVTSPTPLVTYATTSYDLFRGTSSGFAKNLSTKLCATQAAATVTFTDNASSTLGRVANNTTYYYVIRKYNSGYTVASCTGTSGQYTLTTSNNWNNARGTVIACNAESGSTKVTSIVSNFLASGIIAGMSVTGTGIDSATTVASVDDNFEMTLSKPTTQAISVGTLTFGSAVGMAVIGTNIGIGATIQSIDSNTQITLTVAHTGNVSATATVLDFTDSAEQVVIVPNYLPVFPNWLNSNNLCLQSNAVGTTWTASSCTITGVNVKLAPIESIIGTATGDTLLYTGASGSLTQAITTVAGTTYTFSVYLSSLLPSGAITVDIKCGTAVTNCVLNQVLKRFSVTFEATGTSTTVGIYANASSAAATVYCSLMCMTTTSTLANPTLTTTAAAATVAYQELQLRAWSKGASNGAGIELIPTAAPTHTLWSEIFMGTASDFTPTKANMVATTLVNNTPLLQMNLCNDNIVKNITKEGYGGMTSAYLLHLTSSSGNQFINWTFDVNYGVNAPIYLVSGSNNNFFHNWNMGKLRSFIANGFLVNADNKNSGVTLQNFIADEYDNPISNQSLNTVVKGVAGGDTIQTVIASTSDGVAVAYTTVYDTIFNEFYTKSNEGNITLLFNPSAKTSKPYALSGSAIFGANGYLYFRAPGDSIIYTHPHRIYGVTGFRKKTPLVNTLDLGNNVINGILLYKEFCLSTNGTSYGNWEEMTASILNSKSVSATTGFFIKIRLTARAGLKFDGQTVNFIGNEAINGQTSGTTANIVLCEDEGTVGTLVLSDIVGAGFVDNENIRVGTTAYAVANGIIYPQATSYINGLQIYTTVDQSVKYPQSQPTLQLTGLVPGSQVDVLRNSDGVRLFGIASSDAIYSQIYEYYGTNIPVTIVIQSLNYNYLSVPYTLSSINISIPVQQQIDRNYSNPAG